MVDPYGHGGLSKEPSIGPIVHGLAGGEHRGGILWFGLSVKLLLCFVVVFCVDTNVRSLCVVCCVCGRGAEKKVP